MNHMINPRHTRGADCKVCEGHCLYTDHAQALRQQLAQNLQVLERAARALAGLRAAATEAADALDHYDTMPSHVAKDLRKKLRAAIAEAGKP